MPLLLGSLVLLIISLPPIFTKPDSFFSDRPVSRSIPNPAGLFPTGWSDLYARTGIQNHPFLSPPIPRNRNPINDTISLIYNNFSPTFPEVFNETNLFADVYRKQRQAEESLLSSVVDFPILTDEQTTTTAKDTDNAETGIEHIVYSVQEMEESQGKENADQEMKKDDAKTFENEEKESKSEENHFENEENESKSEENHFENEENESKSEENEKTEAETLIPERSKTNTISPHQPKIFGLDEETISENERKSVKGDEMQLSKPGGTGLSKSDDSPENEVPSLDDTEKAYEEMDEEQGAKESITTEKTELSKTGTSSHKGEEASNMRTDEMEKKEQDEKMLITTAGERFDQDVSEIESGKDKGDETEVNRVRINDENQYGGALPDMKYDNTNLQMQQGEAKINDDELLLTTIKMEVKEVEEIEINQEEGTDDAIQTRVNSSKEINVENTWKLTESRDTIISTLDQGEKKNEVEERNKVNMEIDSPKDKKETTQTLPENNPGELLNSDLGVAQENNSTNFVCSSDDTNCWSTSKSILMTTGILIGIIVGLVTFVGLATGLSVYTFHHWNLRRRGHPRRSCSINNVERAFSPSPYTTRRSLYENESTSHDNDSPVNTLEAITVENYKERAI